MLRFAVCDAIRSRKTNLLIIPNDMDLKTSLCAWEKTDKNKRRRNAMRGNPDAIVVSSEIYDASTRPTRPENDDGRSLQVFRKVLLTTSRISLCLVQIHSRRMHWQSVKIHSFILQQNGTRALLRPVSAQLQLMSMVLRKLYGH